MTKRYDYVVLDYNRHKDPAFLAALKQGGEVMVNEFCLPVPHRAQHYLHNSGSAGRARCALQVSSRSAADFFDHRPVPVMLHRSGGARPAW